VSVSLVYFEGLRLADPRQKRPYQLYINKISKPGNREALDCVCLPCHVRTVRKQQQDIENCITRSLITSLIPRYYGSQIKERKIGEHATGTKICEINIDICHTSEEIAWKV
jgi:hypothetical protein